MIRTNLYSNTDSHKIVAQKGIFSVLEYERDISVSASEAQTAFFASQMNIRKRQVIAEIRPDRGVISQSGEMQMMIGTLEVGTDIKGAGDLMKKVIGSKVTGETAIKPRYVGQGTLVLEPTYKYILMQDLKDWEGNMVIEDGMFLACEDSVQMKVTARNTLSSVVLGNEGLFNTLLYGDGVVVMESSVPEDELIVIDMENDTLRIDGSMAIAWSNSLQFTVERTTKTLIGSAASGEGLVNVYRGTGRVLVAPIASEFGIPKPVSGK